jgi:outer membrane protein assembly factor BamB
LWRVPIEPSGSVQGLASSPVYVDGKIILLVDTPEHAYVIAFDSHTGKQVWEAERETGTLGSYATPTVDRLSMVIVAGAKELTGYDAATGKREWWARGVTEFPAAPPFVSGDSVYTVEPAGLTWPPFSEPLRIFDKNNDGIVQFEEMTDEDASWSRSLKGIDRNIGNRDGKVTAEEYALASYDERAGGLARTKLGGNGNVGNSHVVWRSTKGMPFLSGALLYKGTLYVMNDGIFSTYDPENGRELRKERLREAPGEYYASPVAGDDKIYVVSLKGKVVVLKAGGDCKILSVGDMVSEVIATPAIADRKIYLRTAQKLFCFGNSPQPTTPK